mgnify:FL=1
MKKCKKTIILLGGNMESKKYAEIVKRYEVKENRLKNGIVAFIIGGLMGMIGNLLVDFYSYIW